MDVKKINTRDNKNLAILTRFSVGLAIFALLYLLVLSFGGESIDKQAIVVGQIQQGNLDITIDGYGKLASKRQQLISSQSAAQVQEILLKPGARVVKGSVIARLANPELNHQVQLAKQYTARQRAKLKQIKLEQQRELLNEQAILGDLQNQLNTAQLKYQAQDSLFKKGIVKGLEYKETELLVNQLASRYKLMQQRMVQLKQVHEQAIEIQEEEIAQSLVQLNMSEKRLDALNITADFEGVLQKLPVKLGQSLVAGQEVALIGSTKELIAEIQVSQSQANVLKLDQLVQIDTRQGKVSGRISRIDPIVADNNVQIDVTFDEPLAIDARPEQNVDAEILIKQLDNVLYVERPAKANSNIDQTIYKIDDAFTTANRIQITFGEKSRRFITIKSGAVAGEKLILSDLSNYQSTQIRIN